MQLSGANCRSEQARCLKESINDPLANRCKIAVIVAEAWGKEALLAHQREAKLLAILSDADIAIARQFAEEAQNQENTGYN
ncbi:hypothetical protein GRI44_12830 [Altererythrobacter confluentis]|uniref:Uncharacterized protein n=1 Tax=Allopontixanthobacter confluentis TaxID=1849021 RepID=A0A6L7GHU2_9SPHN|nr:hypothetical protein [Allopontixanthobacter confluentis]MXP15633.1 hypothetical protein [Allopontixanthobacter confluentis]